MVRATLADTYRASYAGTFSRPSGTPLAAVTPAALEDFRSLLTRAQADGGKGPKVKTARCIIEGTFRALYRSTRNRSLGHNRSLRRAPVAASGEARAHPF